jgi:uncharacterized protein YjiS (DUF1127 family)
MESPMLCRIDFTKVDYAALSGAERARLRLLAEENAKAERSETLRRMIAGLAAGLHRAAFAVPEVYAAYRLRRRRRLALAELRGLDDHTLKDMGVCRCNIESLIFAGRA